MFWSFDAHNLGQGNTVHISAVDLCGAVLGHQVPPYYGLLSTIKWPGGTLSLPFEVCFVGPPVGFQLEQRLAMGSPGNQDSPQG